MLKNLNFVLMLSSLLTTVVTCLFFLMKDMRSHFKTMHLHSHPESLDQSNTCKGDTHHSSSDALERMLVWQFNGVASASVPI